MTVMSGGEAWARASRQRMREHQEDPTREAAKCPICGNRRPYYVLEDAPCWPCTMEKNRRRAAVNNGDKRADS